MKKSKINKKKVKGVYKRYLTSDVVKSGYINRLQEGLGVSEREFNAPPLGLLGTLDANRLSGGAFVAKTNLSNAMALDAGVGRFNESMQLQPNVINNISDLNAHVASLDNMGFQPITDRANFGLGLDHMMEPLGYYDSMKMIKPEEEKFDKKEAEKLIKEIIESQNKDRLTPGEIRALIDERVMPIEDRQEVSKIGLRIIRQKLAMGGREVWRCPKCREVIEIFEGIEAFEKIKKYVENFSIGKLKACPKTSKHLNWFDIKDDGMVWAIKTLYDCEFRIKHLT